MKRWERTLLWSVLFASFVLVWLLTAARMALIGAVFLLLLVPVSLVWALLARRAVRRQITLSDAGDDRTAVRGTLRVRFGFWRPVGETAAVVTAENRLTGEAQTLRVPLQAQRGGFADDFSLSVPHCGSVQARLREVRLYDWAGIFYVKLRADDAAYCTVLPQMYPVRLPPLARSSHTQESEEERENVRGTDRTQTVWLREYAPGDAIGGIHWKLSSKLGKLIYREPGALEDRSLLVFWDRRQGDPDVLDALAAAVFSLCEALVNAGCPFTLGFVQDGLPVLQRIADEETLYGTLPLLLRRDRRASELLPDTARFGQTIWFTADEAPPDDTVLTVRCVPDGQGGRITPLTIQQFMQETD